MKKQDGRKLSREAKAERRRTMLRMDEEGYTPEEIARVQGSRAAAYALVGKRKKGASAASLLEVGQPGRKEGTHRTLTPQQERRIQRLIQDKNPEQFKFDFALWTRGAVKELIKRETGQDMPVRTVGEYLKRWGFTPQKPAKRNRERNPAAVEKWLNEEYPAIKAAAKKDGGEIFWEDEAGLQTGDVRGRGYAPAGQTPVVTTTAKRERINMISAISNKGKVYWMLKEENFNAAVFKEFLQRLMRSVPHKIYLICDNLKVHHNIELNEWVAQHADKLEIHFLPSYAPDLNPDESLNADVKQGVASRVPARTKRQLEKATRRHLRMLSKSPARIRKYYEEPTIKYAADV